MHRILFTFSIGMLTKKNFGKEEAYIKCTPYPKGITWGSECIPARHIKYLIGHAQLVRCFRFSDFSVVYVPINVSNSKAAFEVKQER